MLPADWSNLTRRTQIFSADRNFARAQAQADNYCRLPARGDDRKGHAFICATAPDQPLARIEQTTNAESLFLRVVPDRKDLSTGERREMRVFANLLLRVKQATRRKGAAAIT